MHMRITIKLFAHHRIGRFKEENREYPLNTSVGQVFEQLRISEQTSGIILVNGQRTNRTHQLKDGDTLALVPLISGG